MEQLAPALHPNKSLTKGTSYRCQFRTLGNAHDTSYDRRDNIKLQKNDEQSRQTAFGKDFGGMAQGDNKMGQKGTNAIFVMTRAEILLIPADCTITFAQVIIDFCPQKADPHCIRITANGNLINYPGELTT